MKFNDIPKNIIIIVGTCCSFLAIFYAVSAKSTAEFSKVVWTLLLAGVIMGVFMIPRPKKSKEKERYEKQKIDKPEAIKCITAVVIYVLIIASVARFKFSNDSKESMIFLLVFVPSTIALIYLLKKWEKKGLEGKKK